MSTNATITRSIDAADQSDNLFACVGYLGSLKSGKGSEAEMVANAMMRACMSGHEEARSILLRTARTRNWAWGIVEVQGLRRRLGFIN